MKNCRNCNEELKDEQQICHKCGQDQGPRAAWFKRWANLSLVVSIAVFIVSFLTFKFSIQQYNKATEALDKAKSLEKQEKDTLQDLQHTEENVRQLAITTMKLELINQRCTMRFGTIGMNKALFEKEVKNAAKELNLSENEKNNIFEIPRLFDRFDAALEQKNKALSDQIFKQIEKKMNE